MKLHTSSLVTRLVVFPLLWFFIPAKYVTAQISDQMNAIREQLVKTEKQMENSKTDTERFVREMRIKEGSCENLYSPLPQDTYLLPGSMFSMYSELHQRFDLLMQAVQPITNLEQEVEARRNELRRVSNELKKRQGFIRRAATKSALT